MYSRMESAVVSGPTVQDVTLEFESTQNGLPGLTIVGLPRASVLESRERVFSALRSAGITLPRVRTTVNLRPGELPKSGSALDLPLALGLLQLHRYIPPVRLGAVGELGLDGSIRSCHGLTAIVDRLLSRCGGVYSPVSNSELSGLGGNIYSQSHLSELVWCLQGRASALPLRSVKKASHHVQEWETQSLEQSGVDALEIALAGGHHLLVYGSPGIGKTYLRSVAGYLLPPLSEAQEREVVVAASLGQRDAHERVISPHHTATVTGMIGGGLPIQAGAVTKAHDGILFLDELPEFARNVLEALRQPLEDEMILLVRGTQSWKLPAACTLIATANPCPCGYFGEVRCQCAWSDVQTYLQRISGPVRDRIDLQVQLRGKTLVPVDATAIEKVSQRIQCARRRQAERALVGYPSLNRKYQFSHFRALQIFPPSLGALEKMSLRRKLKFARVALTLSDLSDREIQAEDWSAALEWIGSVFGEN